MELKAMAKQIQLLFKAENIYELRNALLTCCLKQRVDIFEQYIELVKDLDEDWIQKTYQFFCAKREELKQDYTPKSMADLLAKLVYYNEAKTVYDGCCGTGALSIALWKMNPNLKFYMEELDESVIPFLLFNCCIRNMECVIINGDILNEQQYKKYILLKGKKYSSVEVENIDSFIFPHVDIAVSNPPFSVKHSDEKNPKYLKYNYIQKGNSESAFIINLLERTINYGRCGIILPTGYITNQQTQNLNFRKYLIDNNLLDSCIMCPGDFFESTPTNTSILFIDKEKQTEDFVLIDGTKICHKWVRRQNGFNHTANRTYEKTFNYFSDEDIDTIVQYIDERINWINDEKYILMEEDDFDKNFNFSRGQYLKLGEYCIDITMSKEEQRLWEQSVGHSLQKKSIFMRPGETVQDALYRVGALIFANPDAKRKFEEEKRNR